MNRLYHPRSFLSLLLTGFIFAALPLIVALISSIHILNGMVQQSAVAVYRSVARIDSCRKVSDLLLRQERSARLFAVLEEREHLEDVEVRHHEVVDLLRQFAGLNTDNELAPLIEELQVKEQRVVTALLESGGPLDTVAADQETVLNEHMTIGELLVVSTEHEDAEGQGAKKLRLEAIFDEYVGIGELVSKLELISNHLMAQEVEALKDRVRVNKTTLAWQVSGLIGFSVLLVVLFISLINNPVRQFDRVIERLGEGDFSTPIQISGPRDLENLGAKLDWLRKRLQVLDREKAKMLAHISHELKTPLSSIKEGAGLLKDRLIGPLNDNQVEVVGILDNNCRKLQKLIQDILDFNMAQVRELPMDLEQIQIDRLVEEVTEDHRNAMLARNIQLTMDLRSLLVTATPKQLKTAIDNLLGNAVKFTPDYGSISITMSEKGGYLQLVIEDTGPGISAEDRAQVFLPFYQGTQKSRSAVKGSGLGLAVSKEYIESCGGTLRLLPSLQGARFEVSLPCV
ncbi:MAG: HAMP domain-containing sensor histidine kinase [Desulfobulbus oligotrophicus]|nr:HAMP domain-containing sensor histidine kinase [Desulfobulbus oligotrophicus]